MLLAELVTRCDAALVQASRCTRKRNTGPVFCFAISRRVGSCERQKRTKDSYREPSVMALAVVVDNEA